MKKCPFCAEEIQDEAIKCKHCGEFLTGFRPRNRASSSVKWHEKPHAFFIAFLCVGPFAFPLLWWNPKISVTSKVVWTIILTAFTIALGIAFLKSVNLLMNYYGQMGEIMNGR